MKIYKILALAAMTMTLAASCGEKEPENKGSTWEKMFGKDDKDKEEPKDLGYEREVEQATDDY